MKQKGFTLIELIVVVGIIGLLSALAVISLSRQQAGARDARRLGDLNNINTAIQSYVSEKLDPPTNAIDYTNGSSVWDLSSAPTGGPNVTGFIDNLRSGGYMQRVPVDPVNNATTPYYWGTSLNGFTYGYSWAAIGGTPVSISGYYSYYLAANLELSNNAAITDANHYAIGRSLVFKTVPVRPAN